MGTTFKTFKDLIFVTKPWGEGFQAVKIFPNGYGVSVITEGNSYTWAKARFEVAILRNREICYDTPLTDDVIHNASKIKVSKIMKAVQEFN